MNTEEKAQFDQMAKDLQTALEFIDQLKTASSIPFDVDAALRERFSIGQLKSQTSKTASSENVSIFVTPTTYLALKPPDGFELLNDNGIIKYFPFYT